MLAASAPARQAESLCEITTTERVVAIGDVHGAFDRFVAILREAGLIDQRRRWTGGGAILVQLGDVLDRGPKSADVLDLLRKLEADAPKAGGRVIALVGNHEVMRMQGQVRDVSAEEFARFRSPASTALRDSLYEAAAAYQREQATADAPYDDRAFRKTFYDTTPLGIVEMLRAFAASGEYGRWLRTHGSLARINGVVFVHGGISPTVAPMGCAAIDETTRREIQTDAGITVEGTPLIHREDGPLWYRGLATGDTTPAQVDAVLAALGARAMVVGHTPTPTFKVQALLGGRLFTIDTGMLGPPFYPGGVASALEFKDGVVTAIYQSGREVLSGRATGR